MSYEYTCFFIHEIYEYVFECYVSKAFKFEKCFFKHEIYEYGFQGLVSECI